MILLVLLLCLLISFSLHLFFISKFITHKKNTYLKSFITTAVNNVLISIGIIFVVLYRPETIKSINMEAMLWILSGFSMMFMLLLKIGIFQRIYRRCHMPEHFHYNFFGKKVLHSSVVNKGEVFVFFILMPFFLVSGAYFIARFINLMLYGKL